MKDTDEGYRRMKNIVGTYDALDRAVGVLKDCSMTSTATHLDNADNPTTLEIILLKARLATIRKDGVKAMSDHDIRNGYNPESIEKLLRSQIKHMEGKMTDEIDTGGPTGSQPQTETGGGASEVLHKASQIRRAVYLIKAQRKEIQKEAKEKINILEKGLASLIDDVDEKQMNLFDHGADLSPECQEVLDDPSL